MAKTSPRIHYKINNHRHALPNGKMTGGMLLKPNKDQYELHTHLYDNDEMIHESGLMHDFGSHTHSSELGETSAPIPMSK